MNKKKRRVIKSIFDENTDNVSISSTSGKVYASVTIEDSEEKTVALHIFYSREEMFYHRMPLKISSIKNVKRFFKKLDDLKNANKKDIKKELDGIFGMSEIVKRGES